MKILKFLTLILLLTFTASIISCSTTTTSSRSSNSSKAVVKTKRVPPGQAKKMRGSKSAKRYAPGQNK